MPRIRSSTGADLTFRDGGGGGRRHRTGEAVASGGATTPARLFAATSPFNTKIGANPAIQSNSSAIITAAILNQPGKVLANGGFGVSIVDDRSSPAPTTSDPLNTVTATQYGLDYDPGQFRIPADVGGTEAASGRRCATGSDHHLAIINNGEEIDLFGGTTRADGTHWTCQTRYRFDVQSGSGVAPASRVSAVAANFALTAGIVRPEEIAAGVIDHALVFTSAYTRNMFVAPATHGDGPNNATDAMPLGARIQLDPAWDVAGSGLAAWQKVIAKALQDYGAYCVDTSGAVAFRAETSTGRGLSDIWTPVGVPGSSSPNFSAGFPWGSLRVHAFS